jgi:hypothetical protein
MTRHIHRAAVALCVCMLSGDHSYAVSAPAESAPVIVQAPGSPVRLDRAKVLNAGDQPLVLLYSATNMTGDQLDQFTVLVFVFREGTLKARHVAPARHLLDPHATKYSAMVLDGTPPIEPTDTLVVGVNQVQRVGSEEWWRADLQAAAEDAAKRQKP